MITLLSTIFGIFGSLLPNIVKIFEKKQDYAHELDLRKLELNAAREGIVLQQQMEAIKADTVEGESIRRHDIDIEYTGFWAALRASIRPTITYIFFLLFVGIKVAAFVVMVDRGSTPTELLTLVWDNETMAIFSAIIGFWFGSRAIEKFSDKMYTLGTNKGITVAAEISLPTPTVAKAAKATKPSRNKKG